MSKVEPALAQILIYSLNKDSIKSGMELDVSVSNFRDPLGHKTLTSQYKDGRAMAVRDWIKVDPRVQGLSDSIKLYVYDKIIHGKQDKLVIGFRDHHGKWVSPAVAEIVGDMLDGLGFSVGVWHDRLQ